MLSPELAARIETAVFGGANPSTRLPPGPEPYKDYTIAVERMADILDELHPLHVSHWQETEKYRHGLKLDPDYDHMLHSEKVGGLVQFTVRYGGELVGNLRMYLSRSLHTKTLVAQEDTLYLIPDHRGSFLAMRLIQYAERALRDMGVREIRCNSKTANRADVLMRRMGYDEVAIQFSKIFEE